MSEPSTRSVPFLRPIFDRVAPIFPLSWSSDCPELGRGDHAHSRAHAATAATKQTPKRTRGGAAQRPALSILNERLRECPVTMASRSSFGRDTGLQTRMLFTIFLLGAVYVVFIGVLFASGASTAFIVFIAAALFLFQLFASDKIALRAAGARHVSPAEAPELHAMIDRLCVQADLPKPKVAIAQTTVPNAFAMGRSRKSATVCATTGIMELLSPAELEGVMKNKN